MEQQPPMVLVEPVVVARVTPVVLAFQVRQTRAEGVAVLETLTQVAQAAPVL